VGTQKVHFTLSDEALAIIAKRAPSTNKRGEWLSQVVVDYDQIIDGVTPAADGGALETLGARMGQLERMIAALLVELAKVKTGG
jgi:hypothetical protein